MVVAGLALLSGVVALSGSNPAGAGQFPGTNGKIAYAKYLDSCDCTNIWVINADGTGDTQLTFGVSGSNAYPSWSPDGTRIAFSSDRDGNFEVYVINADGTDQTRVTTTAGGESSAPAWQSVPVVPPTTTTTTTTTVAPPTTAPPAVVVAVTATPTFTG
ncbi:MAG: hypothetical protein EXQ71_10110 [Acidimicrobiia bacterium]|nr:hypothetical protein [Acidimicrobiia bacterium]